MLGIAKGSFLQFYNPGFMRGFGDGVLNGSLWTVCVELQFYFIVPLVYRFFLRERKLRENISLVLLICVSIAVNRCLYGFQSAYAETVFWKLTRVSFLPWIYMFLAGLFLQRNVSLLASALRNSQFLVLLIAYITYATILWFSGCRFDNGVSPLIAFPLFALVMSAAFTRPGLAHRLLKGNDVSYGVYIYHMPIVNMFLYYGLRGAAYSATISVVLSFLLACMSWVLIERPMLKMKRRR